MSFDLSGISKMSPSGNLDTVSSEVSEATMLFTHYFIDLFFHYTSE